MTDLQDKLPSTAAGGRLRMDPRIRERRVAVKRDEGRRRLRVVIGLGALVAAIGAAYGITRSPVLDVDRVIVSGAVSTNSDLISRAGRLDDRPQLADVEPAVVADALERLPWVDRASVVRHWPGTVEIEIIERMPIATIAAEGGGWALVDRTGRVLAVQDSGPQDLAQVIAPGAPAPGRQVHPSAQAGLSVVEALPATLSQLLETVTVADDQTILLGLKATPTVTFGPAEQVRPKLVALSTLLARVDVRGVKGIDVRVPTAPVVTRK